MLIPNNQAIIALCYKVVKFLQRVKILPTGKEKSAAQNKELIQKSHKQFADPSSRSSKSLFKHSNASTNKVIKS